MDIIGLIVANIIPLYILIAIGFVVGKWMDVNLPSMATIAIYVLSPIVNFGAMANMKFEMEFIALPLVVFVISATIGTIAYQSAKMLLKDNTANLIGMSSVTGNTMYFGMPVVLALTGEQWLGVYALLNLGTFLNEVGLGYYFGARGQADLKGAVMKVIKLPVIHGIWLGLLWNLAGWETPEVFDTYWTYAIGAWVLIGMMLIGVALSKQTKLEVDWKLFAWMFGFKFLAWPLATFGVILSDLMIFHAFTYEVHIMLAIMGTVPLAGNLVAYAATLNLHPERAATVVLASTVFAIFTVPAAVAVLNLILDL